MISVSSARGVGTLSIPSRAVDFSSIMGSFFVSGMTVMDIVRVR